MFDFDPRDHDDARDPRDRDERHRDDDDALTLGRGPSSHRIDDHHDERRDRDDDRRDTRFAREKYDHFALRAFLKSLGISLRSATKGRNGRYAYYHCWRQCRAVNITKAKLEGLFVDELKQLQPTAGYMRLVKELVLRAWQERKAEVGREAADTERRAKAVQQKLDRLDEVFLFAQSIDITTYKRQRDRLRQELTLTDIDRHSAAVEKIDVEGILAFAERVLPRASDLWVQASLNQRQRLQQLLFPEGIAFDGKQFVRTRVTASAFKYLIAANSSQNNLASPTPASWNQIASWLKQIDNLRQAA